MNTPSGIASVLTTCATDLKAWSSSAFGQIPKVIQDKRKKLCDLIQLDTDGSLGEEINQVRKEINDHLDSEEIFWGQRAKAHWLREGDKNTKFFHAKASERRKQNTILGIWDKNGMWCEDQESIAKAAASYFEEIFSSSYPSQISTAIAPIPTMISPEMNEYLSRAFSGEEVAAALKQIHPSKSPGPDGMSALFFQKYWNIVGANVTNMVLNVLNSGMPLHDINKTNIALVPKTKNPKE